MIHTLLKFRYFLVFIVLVSCGNNTATKDDTSFTDTTETNADIEISASKKTILCFGDSLTAGFGLDDTNDAFPGVIQSKIDSLGLNYTVINSGLSGETSSGGRNRLNWVLNQEIDIFLLELGANDGLRGTPLNETKDNLQAIINAVKAKNPDTEIIIAGMQLPPNIGQDYTTKFRNLFPDLAKQNNLHLIPFLLENVGGIPSLNQDDGIHPTVEGQKIVANNVWKVLETMLEK